MWLSARDPESIAIMLFGDRIRPHAIVPTRPEETRPLRDSDVYATLLGLLDRLGCGVASNR